MQHVHENLIRFIGDREFWCLFAVFFFLSTAELPPKRYWRGPKSQDLGEEGDYNYNYCYIATTRMTPALRWAVMRASLTFH